MFETFAKISNDEDGMIIKDDSHEKQVYDSNVLKKLLPYYGHLHYFVAINIMVMIINWVDVKKAVNIGKWSSDEELQKTDFLAQIKYIAILVFTQAILQMARQMSVKKIVTSTMKRLHGDIWEKICLAPVNLFYDVTPMPIIKERFQRQIHEANHLIHMMIGMFYQSYHLISIVYVIG